MRDPGHQEAKSSPRARVVRLTDAVSDDLSATTTAAERVEMVGLLSRRMWEISGRPMPSYARSETPGRVLRNP
jgi:hypothetical protein